MKIALTKPSFYFNDPINLTPYVRSIDVDLASLDNDVVRKLNLGVVTGVVEIIEGGEDFKARIDALAPKEEAKVETVEETKTVEVKVETKEKVDVDVKEEVKVEQPDTSKRKTTTTTKKPTTTKKV